MKKERGATAHDDFFRQEQRCVARRKCEKIKAFEDMFDFLLVMLKAVKKSSLFFFKMSTI